MRIVDRHYSDLLPGYDRIVEYQRQFDDLLVKERERVRMLNAQAEQNYRAQLEHHRLAVAQIEASYQKACAAWEKSEQPSLELHQRRLAEWRGRLRYAVRRMDAEIARQRAALAEEEAMLRRAAAASLFVVTIPFTLAAAVILSARIARRRKTIEALRLQRNLIHATPEPPYKPLSPKTRRADPPPEPVHPVIVPFPQSRSMLDDWWAYLEQPPPWLRNEEREYTGLKGELALLDELSQALDDAFIAIHGVLIRYKTDGDIVVLGGNGVWVLECKYVSGKVRYDGHRWLHLKPWRPPGGQGRVEWREKEGEVFNPAEQWQQQYGSISKTLKMRVQNPHPPVTGGLVFTIDETDLDIPEDCPVAWGRIADWVRTISRVPVDMRYSERDLVACAYHILNFSQRSDSDQTASAIDVSEMIFSNYANALQRFKAQYRLQT